MDEKQLLMIPGPTAVPQSVLLAAAQPMVNHRGPEFRAALEASTEGLKRVFQTSHEVYILSSSGTGGLEAAVVNMLSPGDKVLSVSIGVFGDRFASIAETYGVQVEKIEFPMGSAPRAVPMLNANRTRQAFLKLPPSQPLRQPSQCICHLIEWDALLPGAIRFLMTESDTEPSRIGKRGTLTRNGSGCSSASLTTADPIGSVLSASRCSSVRFIADEMAWMSLRSF